MRVRAVTADDAAAIRSVHLDAFPTSTEADLVERLANDGEAVISIVAEDRGQIVGHILFSRMRVEADGRSLSALGLAPVAVLRQRQREGIGSALIERGLAAAKERATDIIFVLGEPAYYGRFGFDAERAKPFASPYAGPYYQALVLNADAINASAGRADYASAFQELA